MQKKCKDNKQHKIMEKIIELMNQYKAHHARCMGLCITTYLDGSHELTIKTSSRMSVKSFKDTEKLVKFLSK